MKKLAILCLAVVFVAGCNNPYGGCVKAGAAVADSVAQGIQSIDQLRQQGLITPAEELSVLGYLEFANKGDEAFLSCVSIAHTNPSKTGAFTSCAQAFNTTLNTPTSLALVHVSNTTAQATINVIVNGLTTGVTAVTTALNGA